MTDTSRGDVRATRPVAGVVTAALASAFGAVLLGEQPLEGTTALVAGVLFGVVVAEVLVSVARAGDGYLALAAGVLTQAGFVWALYIETGHALDEAAPSGWAGAALAAAAAAAWVRSAARRGRGSRSGPRHTPGG
ncbi:MAG TPA: hypothetical protein VFV35_04010 [Acidimicrobiales bacterium]|nr:hypothetical protein [Acidimicrobiales bacterium]